MILLKKAKKLNKKIIFSKYLETSNNKSGYLAIFHKLFPDPIFIKKQIWNKFLFEPNKHPLIIEKLKEKKLILNSKKEDISFLKNTKAHLINKLNNTQILYLVLTKSCNFNCLYCPFKESKKNNDSGLMDKQTLVSGINLWKKDILENFNKNIEYYIIFYGGEPLLNLDILEFGLSYINELKKTKQLPKSIKILLPTNGSLINDKTIKILKKYNVMVTVGLDGSNIYQNSTRKTFNNKDSFNNTISVIKKIIKNKISCSISTTITPKNIKHLDRIYILSKQLGIKKIGLNFLKADGLKNLIKKSYIKKYYEDASDAIIKNLKKYNDYYYEFQAEKKFTSFIKKDFFPIDCTCYGNQLVIMPNGDITNCPFAGAPITNIKNVNKDFRIRKTKKIKLLRKRFPVLNKNINLKQYWISLYGGGCAWNSEMIWNNTYDIDKGIDIFTKKMFDFLLWLNFKNKK